MVVSEIEAVAREQMATRQELHTREPGHLFYHGQRTAKIALALADRDTLYVGALFHDIGKGSARHNEKGADLTARLLRRHCSETELASIRVLITLHNRRKKSAEHPLAAQIVQDADLIDHVGPMVPWLAFYWCGVRAETIDDHIAFVTGEENERYRTGMRAKLNFDVSMRLFDERIQWEDEYLETFRRVYFDGVWQPPDVGSR